ncbi:hypothetical protein [Planctomycetes bacterium CA13]
MRPFSMFARRSEPSAEALAGAGPTTTYPAPPSASATPEAIASVAGGTAGSTIKPEIPGINSQQDQIASLGISPGYAVPASANMSAAEANGFTGGSKSASYASTNPTGATTSGYQFGKKTFTPKTTLPESSASNPALGNSTNNYAKLSGGLTAPSAQGSPTGASTPSVPSMSGYTSPASYAPPSLAASKTSEPATPSSGLGGFTLPDSMKTEIATTAAAPVAEARTAAVSNLPGLDAGMGTANTTPSYTPPAMSTTPSSSGGGYMPGSTGKASAYPGSGSSTPTSNSGSFYR